MTLTLLLACAGDWQSLEPYDNPFDADEPVRARPLEVAVLGDVAVVPLQGNVDHPGEEVALVDLGDESVRRVTVGSSPTGVAVHPDGEHVLVFNRFSNWASLVDVDRGREVERWPMDFYAIEGAFDDDGRLWVSNRWKDAVQVFSGEGELLAQVPVGSNPRDLAVGDEVVAVATLTGGEVSLIDRRQATELHRVDLGAPANGLTLVGDWLVVATLSASTHHLPLEGPDTDGDGRPGDSTPNVNFQDLQNELAVIDTRTGDIVWRYTSDSLCCFDYRDVDPSDGERLGELLPSETLWTVEGALPEQLTSRGQEVWVSYSGSNQVQHFELDAETGALQSLDTWETQGHAPHALTPWGEELLVVHRLSDSLGLYRDGVWQSSVDLSPDEAPAYPSTDAEIGELVNAVTSGFSVDGDMSCTHCHREGGNIDKAFSMPLTLRGGVGLRMTMAYRGAADTRPWFFESAMDESNFKPVLNEFARIENFCCSDYTLWPEGAPADCGVQLPECEQPNPGSEDGFDPTRDRPPEQARPTPYATRDAFFLAAAQQLLGRQQSFGDGLYFEDPISGQRQPIDLDFDGITRALGRFLLVAPRLLPNPNVAEDLSASAARGKALFESPSTGCSACHPSPAFTLSHSHNPDGLPLRIGPVVSPHRSAEGLNLDLLAPGFSEVFPQAEQESCTELCGDELCLEEPESCDDLRDVMFGVPSLRGIWDRAPSMLHDGRAQGLREVICTPGHPALQAGEQGFNERDGVVDSHGGTSHLAPDQIEDLLRYLESL